MESDYGGWLVFQGRLDGSVDFDRKWKEYEQGFGDLKNEFWLGLAQLHALTKSRRHRLRINLGEETGEKHSADYSTFSVGGPETNYRLHVSGYSGNAGDGMSLHNDQSFSTPDRDNDKSSHNCAARYTGGWWYGSCPATNLNSRYKAGGAKMGHGLFWKTLNNGVRAFMMSEMKIKPA